MTKEELCIRACRYAIRELTRKGSTGFITSSDEGGQYITWVEVMEWLGRDQHEDAVSMMDLLNNLHKQFSKGFENDEWWNSTHVLQAIKDCRPELFDLNYVPSAQPKQTECEDAISRQAAINIASGFCHPSNIAKELAKLPSVQPKYNTSEWCHDCKEYDQDKHCCPRFNRVIRNAVEEIKQPKTGHCKDCKYFEYDHFENMGGIPLITAHKVCKRHGLICKTDEDGYCYLWEHKAESEE